MRDKKEKKVLIVQNFFDKQSTKDSEENEEKADQQPQIPDTRKIKLKIFTLWLPCAGTFTIALYLLIRYDHFYVNKEVLTSLLNSSFILLGFSLTSRYALFQLRDSKSLKTIQSTVYWIRHEFMEIVVILLLVMSVLIALVNLLMRDINEFLAAVDVGIIITVLIYAVVSFVNTNKFGIYT